jgi:hypothetical protein
MKYFDVFCLLGGTVFLSILVIFFNEALALILRIDVDLITNNLVYFYAMKSFSS